MAEVTGTIGNERVELNNAATEATLRAMLAAMNRQTAALSALRTGGGAGSGGGAGGQTQASQQLTQATNQQTQATGQQTVATTAATKSMNAFSKTAMILGGVIGDLVGGVAKTVGNLTDFAGGLLDGKGGLSDFYGSLKDLPLGLGVVAGLFQKIAQMQEAELETYRTMTKAGVNFGGQLNAIRQNALQLGMTLDEFAGFVTKNSDALSRMGGTTDEGARNFVKLSTSIRNSKLGEELRGLGYTTQELNDGMASYISSTGGRNAAQMKDTNGLAAAAGNYLKQLDALAEMTGQSREELEKQQKAAAQDAAYQMALSGKSEAEKAKAAAALAEMQAKYGKAGADAFKAKFLGMPPISEQAQGLTATVRGFDKALSGVVGDVKDNGKSMKDVDKSLTGVSQAVGKAGKELGPQMIYAVGQSGDKLGETFQTVGKHAVDLDAKGATSAEKEMALREKIAEDQRTRERSAAAAAAESEKAFKDMGAAIYGALQPALAMLTPVVNDLAKEFMYFVQSNMPAIKESVTKFATFVTNFAKDLFSEDGQKKIINDIAYYFKLMMIEVKKSILPWYSEADAEKDKKKLDEQKSAYDAKAEQTRLASDAARRDLTLQLDGSEAKQKAAKEEIQASQETIKDAKAKLDAGKITAAQYEELRKKEQSAIDLKSAALANLGSKGTLDEEKRKKLEQEQQTQKTGSADADAKMAKVKEQEVKDKTNQGTVAGNAAGMAAGAVGGGVAGGIGGGVAGAWAGGIIGSLAGPVGTVLGASIGAEIGTWLGGAGGVVLGGLLGKTIGDKMSAPTETAVRAEMEEAEKKKKGVPARADGGPVKAGQPYWVGEEGPEIMVPDAAGNITPNDKTSELKPHIADMTKSINGNFKGVASDMVASTQQQQPITLSRESIAALGKLLPLDSMSSTKQLDKMPYKELDNKKFQEKDTYNETLKKLIPDPTAKATPVLEGKESKLTEQPKTPMLTDMLGSFAKTIMPEFMSKIPSVGDIGKKIEDIKKDPKAEMESMGKSITDGIKNVASMSPAGALLNPLMGSLGGTGGNENLVKEMQQLNKNTVELIKYTKMTLEENKSQTSKLGSLSGNLYV
jgi:hypothetical protein